MITRKFHFRAWIVGHPSVHITVLADSVVEAQYECVLQLRQHLTEQGIPESAVASINSLHSVPV